MIPGCVDQCVCFRTSFADWLRRKQANGWSMEEAARNTLCGEGCGYCKPYLRVVAATGQTVVPLLTYEEMLALDPDGR